MKQFFEFNFSHPPKTHWPSTAANFLNVDNFSKELHKFTMEHHPQMELLKDILTQ
jgi:hypothetical protein